VTAGQHDPGQHDPGQHDPGQHDPGQRDPGNHDDPDLGRARERTSLAWTRTALSFAAVGVVVLRKDVVPGLIILCAVPVTWQLGRLAHHLPGRLELVTVTIVVVALAALTVAVTH
jgi:uncharacterized membrane protein YidH (DUF202 family)